MTLPPDVSKVDLGAYEIDEQQSFTSIVNKVLRVMNDGLNDLKISLVIVQALHSPEVLKCYMSEEDIKILTRKCEIFTKHTNYWGEDRREDAVLNYRLDIMVESLSKNKQFMRNIPDNLKQCSKLSYFFVTQIEEILKLAELRVQTPARVDLSREKLVQEAYKENELLKESINVCRNILEEKDRLLQEKINKEKESMNNYKTSLEELKASYKIEVKKARDEACQKIIQITTYSETAQERLKEDKERAVTLYENILKENLMEEKKLREKKQRVLAQLIALIEKYDSDMVERYLEIQQIKDRTAEKKKELDDFMVVFKEKQKEYRELFKDDDDDEDDETRREAKILKFQMNHAAKVIQRAWRAYKASKKKKKGKGRGKLPKAAKPKGTKEKKKPKKKSEDTEKKVKGPKGKKSKVIVKEDPVDEKMGGEEKAKTEEVDLEKDKGINETVAEKEEGDEEKKETDSEIVTEKQEGHEEKKEANIEAVAEKQEGDEEKKEADNKVVAAKQEGDEEKKEADNEVVAEKQEGVEETKEADNEVATGKKEGNEEKKEADSEVIREKQEEEKHAEGTVKVEIEEGSKGDQEDQPVNDQGKVSKKRKSSRPHTNIK